MPPEEGHHLEECLAEAPSTPSRRPIAGSCSTDSLLSFHSREFDSPVAILSPDLEKQHPATHSAGAWTHARKWCVCQLSRMPVQASGIALNVVAIAGLLNLLERADHSWRRVLQAISSVLCLEASVLLGLYVARSLFASDFVRGLSSRTVISSHSVCLTAVQILFAQPTTFERLGRFASTCAGPVVHASAALGVLLTGRFVYLVARRDALVEPSWFPSTVSLASLCHASPAVDTPQWVRQLALICGCAATALLWPPCAYRALRYPDAVACDPSIFILMAPVPFVTMAMYVIAAAGWWCCAAWLAAAAACGVEQVAVGLPTLTAGPDKRCVPN